MKVETAQVWVLSTEHISQETADLLTEWAKPENYHSAPLSVGVLSAGRSLQVRVPCDWEEFADEQLGIAQREIPGQVVPDDLRAILRAANRDTIDRVEFDADADVCEAFPTFEWN